MLVALDGSAESEDILPEAERVAAADADVYLLHVHPALAQPHIPLPDALSLPDKAFAYLEDLRRRRRRSKVQSVVRQGDPAEEILQGALELGADLLAMTTHGRGGLRRVLLGSVAEEVLRRSRAPVLLARPGCPRPGLELREILVPLDGLPRSAEILGLVKDLALERRALVRLLHVIVPMTVAVPVAGLGATAPAELSDPRPALRELAKPLKDVGLKVRVQVVAGYAVPEILRAAREAGSDLIAMTTSGKRGLTRFFLGSVAEELLREADRPLLLKHVPEGPT